MPSTLASREGAMANSGVSPDVFGLEDVFRIVFDVMSFQNSPEFIFETQRLVVFLLSLDILPYDR